MKKLAVITVILAALVLGLWLARDPQTVHAQSPMKATVPKAWGRCVGTIPGGVVFEDSPGVVRMTDMQGNLQAEFDRN